ncbi:unnamed protein product [Caenorhabditis angaria]|uniref:Uncharacterized protein n=1 Tax=Caenorhabditis angaria TaxID=860376 RepID=A0A9P1IED7_9PELO|nr:unnamed protein product [Caenorhabditis angaria]
MKLLLILLISQVSSTIITVKGTIRCNLFSSFNATITLQEKDTLGSDDIKIKVWKNKPSNVTHNFSIKGDFTDGDGIFDGEYEPALYIVHNCRDIGFLNEYRGEANIGRTMGTIYILGNVYREFKSVPITAASANYTGVTIKLDNRVDL